MHFSFAHLISYLSLEGALYEKFSCSHLVLYTFAYYIYKVKTLNRFANFFSQSTDTQTIIRKCEQAQISQKNSKLEFCTISHMEFKGFQNGV